MDCPCSSVTLPAFLALLFFRISSASPTCESPVLPNGNYSTSRYPREAITIRCVSSSYDKINWFFKPYGDTTELEEYPFSWCERQRCSLCNTTMNIAKVNANANGSFICNASSSATGRSITARLILIVQDCETKAPEILPVQNVSVSLMQTATLTCKAHVGHCYEGSETYLWAYSNRSKISNSTKYTTVQKLDGDTLTTTLDVHDVTKMDLTSYICILIDDFFVEGHKAYTVSLSETETFWEAKNSTSTIIQAVIVPLLALILIVIIVCVCCCLCGGRIRFCLKKGKMKTRGLKKYDAIIYKDDDDEDDYAEEARELRRELESLKYEVCTPDDGLSGTKLQSLEELIDCSASVIFLCRDDNKKLTMILDKAQENLSVFLVQKKKPKSSNQLKNVSMAGFVRLRWPSHRSSLTACKIMHNLHRDEFYFKLRIGLPKPMTDSGSLEIFSETNPHNDMNLGEEDHNFV